MKKSEVSENSNVFDNLMNKERIFRNREALSSTFIPSEFPHRNDEINSFANILKPALYGARPSNILIYGQTGTGKTAVAKFLCEQILEKAETENKKIHTAYINCKQTNIEDGKFDEKAEPLVYYGLMRQLPELLQTFPDNYRRIDLKEMKNWILKI